MAIGNFRPIVKQLKKRGKLGQRLNFVRAGACVVALCLMAGCANDELPSKEAQESTASSESNEREEQSYLLNFTESAQVSALTPDKGAKIDGGELIFAMKGSASLDLPADKLGDHNYLHMRVRATSPIKGLLRFGENREAAKEITFFLQGGEQYETFRMMLADFEEWSLPKSFAEIEFIPLAGEEAELRIDYVNFTSKELPKRVDVGNGEIRIGADLLWGGAIDFLSLDDEEQRNVVNRHDTGRLIQQSYYGVDYTDAFYLGRPAPWNPVQGGDQFQNRSKIIDYSINGNEMYIKAQALDWARKNELTEAYLESFITLEGNMAKLVSRIVYFGELKHPSRDQELPAVYVIPELSHFVTYNGEAPFTNDPELYWQVDYIWPDMAKKYMPEYWSAWVDDKHWGLGVYTEEVDFHLAGGYRHGQGEDAGLGDMADATNYIAPVAIKKIEPFVPFEYTTYLVLGDLDDIRAKLTGLYLNSK